MNKDQIAIFLNEHPEFFNDYPELLRKIKSIEEKSLPLEPLSALSLADRIIKRVHDDKEHFKSKLEWLVEVSSSNEKILENHFEIERLILTSGSLEQLAALLSEEIPKRFGIPFVRIYLVDGQDHFIENRLKKLYPIPKDSSLECTDQKTVVSWFEKRLKPILRQDVKGGSNLFTGREKSKVKSEALIPIVVRGAVAGAIVLGSESPRHFHEGLRTDHLERMAEKIVIAIDHILLVDRLSQHPALDIKTGLFNRSFLELALMREFDRARRNNNDLSLLKLQIDLFPELLDTHGKEKSDLVVIAVAELLRKACGAGDVLIRNRAGGFFVLLPETGRKEALKAAQKILTATQSLVMDDLKGFENPTVSIGIAAYPSGSVDSRKDLVDAASKSLAQASALGQKQVISI